MECTEGKMKCDRCSKMVDETTTGSCSIGGIEITDYIDIDKKRLNKLCSFEDQFYCKECLDGNICVDCSKILTTEEKAILKNADKI